MLWIPLITLALAWTSDRSQPRRGPLKPPHPGWLELQDQVGELIRFYDFPNELGLWIVTIAEADTALRIFTDKQLQAQRQHLAHHAPRASMDLSTDDWAWTVRQGQWLIQPKSKTPPADAEALYMELQLPGKNREDIDTIQIWKTRT